MFAELYIENLALIEKAGLVWQPGLNVLSGETGAGKSMLLDAVSLLLGGRAERDLIRRGAETCRVEGRFLPPFSAALTQKLAELGLAGALDDGELVLSREFSLNGRSANRLNLRPVPLAALREIARLLLNIHGQREHMLLLEPANQLHLLDSFGGAALAAARQNVAAAYRVWRAAADAVKQARQEQTDDAERQRFLVFQIKELEAARLTPGESEALAAEAQALTSVQRRSGHANAAYQAVYGGRDAALTQLDLAAGETARLAELDSAVQPLAERLQGLYYDLEDAAVELRDYKEAIVDDAARLEEISARQFEIKALCKRYNADEAGLLALLAANRAELAQRENREEYLAELAAREAELQTAYARAAADLHNLRAAAGQKLAARITAELRYLQMSRAEFAVSLLPKNPAADGSDEACFMICPNAGEEQKPVAKIASGGEMSRIMLAIKVILAGLDEVPTLIFDEIDTGLGGRALQAVAEKLVQVAGSAQAICVTHAPVLAAYADNNLLVAKRETGGRTVTEVTALSAEEKVAEISRMLAGGQVTDTTRRQAAELIAAGEKLKKKN